jgi:hypothetical protein
MQTVYDAHPSFTRDRDIEKYYDEYCQLVAEIFAQAETKEKRV